MSDSDDLLRKTDAFLDRYRGAMPQDDIPVLTEVVGEPAAESAQTADPEQRALEERLRRSLLDAIAPYVASFLEEPLRLRAEAHLRRALDELARALRTDVQELVNDAVSRAVRRELDRERSGSG